MGVQDEIIAGVAEIIEHGRRQSPSKEPAGIAFLVEIGDAGELDFSLGNLFRTVHPSCHDVQLALVLSVYLILLSSGYDDLVVTDISDRPPIAVKSCCGMGEVVRIGVSDKKPVLLFSLVEPVGDHENFSGRQLPYIWTIGHEVLVHLLLHRIVRAAFCENLLRVESPVVFCACLHHHRSLVHDIFAAPHLDGHGYGAVVKDHGGRHAVITEPFVDGVGNDLVVVDVAFLLALPCLSSVKRTDHHSTGT